MSSLYLRPIPIKCALKWCASVHRRLPSLQGAMWAIAVLRGGVTDGAGVTLAHSVVGVAIVGRPTARLLDQSESGHKGACSMLYAACARAARTMGAVDCS